ncbi:hypothetical protein DWG24_03945 [Dickeya zeae]|uniref:Uncharacterized protein n=1 Tax=Dickeya zeae TaxID=204042 RepID=A0AAE6YWV7_9GAMM|nr:hypothetical protein DWG24_03945 [Dickeya zeae]
MVREKIENHCSFTDDSGGLFTVMDTGFISNPAAIQSTAMQNNLKLAGFISLGSLIIIQTEAIIEH